MKFEKHGNIYQLTAKQKLPLSLEEAWAFMSAPDNLKVITPDYMGFDILSGADRPMYPGQIIQYIVKPVLGIESHWVTEITHVVERNYFVDEQRFGPYALWHHKHFLAPLGNGVEMEDVIHYKLPFAPLSNAFHGMIIKPKLTEIFMYRKKRLTELFGTYKEQDPPN